MLQFYFLSVLLNLVVGLILFCSTNKSGELVSADEVAQDSTTQGLQRLLDSRNTHLVLGVLSVLIGLMKLLSVVQNDVPIIGDLLPALAGLCGGFCILIDYYMSNSTVEYTPTGLIQVIYDSRKIIGLFCIVVAVLHFIFPKVLFL
ncbi:MAG: hypothetical protein J6B81_02340 [Spirochaetaceae bacterium]|nr:hypothetical protein [Spirochaetaceae bacterium]